MNSNDYIQPNLILSDVLLEVHDEILTKGYSKGWYISQVQQALEELSIDTFFQEITYDVDYPSDNNQIDLPKNCFNIREIYLHNGTCCGVTSSAIVHPKRLFNNKPFGVGSTSLRKDSTGDTSVTTDPVYPPDYVDVPERNVTQSNLYYYNVQNGVLMLSSNSSSYSKVRLVYNGMGGEIGEQPIIPRFFRQAVKFYVLEAFWRSEKGKDNPPRSARLNWADANNDKEKQWIKAKMRITSMDARERQAMREYYAHGNW